MTGDQYSLLVNKQSGWTKLWEWDTKCIWVGKGRGISTMLTAPNRVTVDVYNARNTADLANKSNSPLVAVEKIWLSSTDVSTHNGVGNPAAK